MTIHHWRVWHNGMYTHFIPQWSCNHILVLWAVMVVIQSAICWHLWVDIYPSTKCTQACWSFHQGRHTCPLHTAWNLHPSSLDAPPDFHGRSCSFLFIHCREVFLAWCWVIARPLSSCGIILLSLPLGVGLTGMGLEHLSHAWWIPTHKAAPASDAIRSQLWCRMHEFPCWSFTSYEGMSVVIWCTTLWGLSFHLSLIFLFSWKVFALIMMRSPGFKPTVSIFQSLYCFCLWASAVDWALASWGAVLKRSITVAMYSSTCLVEVSLLGPSALLKVGK